MMQLKELMRYYNTLKYLHAEQTFGRVWSAAKKKICLMRIPPVPENLSGKLERTTEFLYHDPWNDTEKLNEGKYTFLNEERNLGHPVRWAQYDAPLLWQYNLHYFNYLFLLSPQERENLCLSWIAENPFASSPGWEPYPLSLRIVNWCKCYMKSESVNNSLYLQTEYLFRTLEFYHPGNHYLENAKALVFAGVYFSGYGESKKWFDKGIDIIMSQTPRQVLSDGCYFEKTMMYHSIMLGGYLDIINILEKNRNKKNFLNTEGVIEYLKYIAGMMGDFLSGSYHPDGSIALFNDSTEEIAPQPESLISYGKRIIGESFAASSSANIRRQYSADSQNSGYFTIKSESVFCMIDGGSIGPDFLPAHAHADIFSYEASIGGVKTIVDSGVYEYETGEMRSYVRSTKAHNTFCVDGIDMAECWGSFRVARRYPPYSVSFSENNSGSEFDGSFSGYSKIIGDDLCGRRNMQFNNKEKYIRVNDRLTGRGSHLFESYIHFHPDAKIKIFNGQIMVLLQGAAAIIEILSGNVKIEKSWYCPRFGVRIENKTAVVSFRGQLPCKLEYKISY
jgi:uncharacterized heparinase superfamily protein